MPINLSKKPIPSIPDPCMVIPIQWCVGTEVWHLGDHGAECSEVTGIRMEHHRREWTPVVRYSLQGQGREFTEAQLHPTRESLLAWVGGK